jgi:16S rRNA (guanine966-N2)-methyltransferase
VTRVVAGAARGRPLSVPPGSGTRPTSDRAREGLFSTLRSMLGTLDGACVLDLYAGSGAVGLEALSRGAAHALFVESDPGAARTIGRNARALGLSGARVVTGRVQRVLSGPAPAPYDVAFADPPYATSDPEVVAALTQLIAGGWLAAGGVVVVERPSRAGEFTWPTGMVAERSRRYGEATLWYGRAADTG